MFSIHWRHALIGRSLHPLIQNMETKRMFKADTTQEYQIPEIEFNKEKTETESKEPNVACMRRMFVVPVWSCRDSIYNHRPTRSDGVEMCNNPISKVPTRIVTLADTHYRYSITFNNINK